MQTVKPSAIALDALEVDLEFFREDFEEIIRERLEFECPSSEIQESQLLETVDQLIRFANQDGDAINEVFRRLKYGHLLSEALFYLHMAQPIVPWVIDDFIRIGLHTDYERYCLMHYEDEDHRGLIGTDAHERLLNTDGGRRIALFRLSPALVSKSALTAEQLDFWSTNFPAEFQRFKK